jgi:predicted small lipoprotein YifL
MLLKKYFVLLIITTLCAITLTACGNKGDLYLPSKATNDAKIRQ